MPGDSWPRVQTEAVPWRGSVAADHVTRRVWEEMQQPYEAAVVPAIAAARAPLSSALLAEVDDATAELARFDAEIAQLTAPYAFILLRSESASSSQIENLTSGARAISEVDLGERDQGNAALIVSNVRAMKAAIDLADDLSDETIISMQRLLLETSEPELTGRYREQQVWIGGSNFSPHRAAFVPPVPERVPAAMADLLTFARRTDLPSLVGVALVHAQFETIHPFPDGNGRTGRALAQSMLRRSGVTRHVTVPISSGLLAQRDAYFAALTTYRQGDLASIVGVFTDAVFLAVANGRRLAHTIADLQAAWGERLADTKSTSSAHRLAVLAIQHPVLNSSFVEKALGVPPKTALAALARLEAVGILRPASAASRNRVWLAFEVIAALDAFADRSTRRF
ncbi:Fic family protein [Subtercola boreus]|nr:Fic family protein [Subtercola boreus]